MIRKTLKEIASLAGGEVIGDENAEITGIKGIDEACEGDLTFAVAGRYLRLIGKTGATAVLLAKPYPSGQINQVVVGDPYVALAKLLHLYYPAEKPAARGGEGAYIEPDAVIEPGAAVFPQVYIGRRCRIKKGAVIYPGVKLGDDVCVGEETVIHPNVSVYRRTLIGARVVIHAGAVIGGDGFGYAHPGRDNLKIPQVGYVQIDDEVEIGANTTIDRGTLGKTWIKRGAKIDNLVQIAHNVTVGENSVIAGQAGIAGSARLGNSVLVGGQAGIVGHITIGDQVMVAARSGVHKDVEPQRVVAGSPHLPHREWLKKEAALIRVPELIKKVADLKEKLRELEEQLHRKRGRREGKA